MLSLKTKIIFVIIILIAFFLEHTETTSADIFAERVISKNRYQVTTLSFSDRQTSNNTQIFNLFNVSGFLPGGFDVRAVRVKKDGKLNFKYHIKAIKKAGDDTFCQALNIEVLPKSGVTKYKGPLLALSLDAEISNTIQDDWILFISLDNNNNNLMNKSCEFDLLFNTFHNQPDENPVGFHAERTLTNTVLSGNW